VAPSSEARPIEENALNKILRTSFAVAFGMAGADGHASASPHRVVVRAGREAHDHASATPRA